MSRLRLSHCVAVLAVYAIASTASALVTIDWVPVGDPGNTGHVGGVGAVADVYRISKFEATVAQYTEFLNAVADTDPNELYTVSMAGAITRSGTSGSFAYSAVDGRQDKPVNFVSFWDSIRFANWLHNGQPTGAQDNTTTEDGAYTITETGISNNSITRNAGAMVFVTSENEWYKAAYYDAVSTNFFNYPAGSNTPTTCAVPGATANTANCDNAVGDLTDVGSYTDSASPNGTFDQGGNVMEWTETVAGFGRIQFGGSAVDSPNFLAAPPTVVFIPIPSSEDGDVG